ncbi:PREDICTED: mucin-12-like [Colobus angolensis palliatus]|uniref:mucin-12-like n=1 Tax=Colobus angolensis palliatus TaxID=336983 RepID=UPI0005F524DC|nr:PREDICTED: mucin-12-like [Colobus angolensis palliatus]
MLSVSTTTPGLSKKPTTIYSSPRAADTTLSPGSNTSSGIREELTTSHSRPGSMHTTLLPASATTSGLRDKPTTTPSMPDSQHTTLLPASATTSGLRDKPTTTPSMPDSQHTTLLPASITTSGLSEKSTTTHRSPGSTETKLFPESTTTSGHSEQSTAFTGSPGSTEIVLPATLTTTDLDQESTAFHSSSNATGTTPLPPHSTTSALVGESTTFYISPSTTYTTLFPASSSTSGLTGESTTLHTSPSFPFTIASTESLQTLVPGSCQEGQIWNGKQCVCPQGYVGYQCLSPLESFLVETPEKLNATLGMTVKVTYRNFTEQMNDLSSQEYQNFNNLFKNRMDVVLTGDDLPQYRGVNIRKLLNGSIVVKNDVILEADYTSEYEELFENLVEIVKAKIMNETKAAHHHDRDFCREAILCYSGEDTFVDSSVTLGFDFQEQCTQKAAKEYAQFYYADVLDGKLACVNKCTKGTKSQMNCNLGICQLQRSGPRCLCPNTDTHWYWGETCEWNIAKSLVYGIVGAVVAVLLLSLIILVILFSLSQRKLHRQQYDMPQEWRNEGTPGTFQKTAIWEDQNLRESRFGLENAYNNFRPTLETVDSGTELHIQRPEMVASAV